MEAGVNWQERLEECRNALVESGLSEAGVLKSRGVNELLERAESKLVSGDVLNRYAADLKVLTQLSADAGEAIPVHFWGVCTPAIEADQWDEFTFTHRLAQPEYREYVGLLGRSYGWLVRFKEGGSGTAVAAALGILRDTSDYLRTGHRLDMTEARPGLTPYQQAIFLWQQIVTGTNRQIPYLHRDAYTHGCWARFNVVEMWRYHVGSDVPVDEVWGLSGFAPRFVGDATNTNQIEHMVITAVAQMVLGLPLIGLNLLEEMEWILRQGTRAAGQADKLLNRAIAKEFRPRFRVEDPEPACVSLENTLKE